METIALTILGLAMIVLYDNYETISKFLFGKQTNIFRY